MKQASPYVILQQVSGMTLIEVLVALLLLSILSLGILSALSSGHRAYAAVVRTGRGMSDVASAQTILRRLIESAYPFGAAAGRSRGRFGLEGTHERLFLTAPMPQAAGAQGLYRYELLLSSRTDGGRDLVIRYGVDREGEFASGRAPESGAQEEILVERVRELRCDYLARPAQNRFHPVSLPHWVESWHEAALPMLMRVTVEFDPADPRRWPDFVAGPRLTDGAQCVFDLISGACREGS